MVGVIGRMKIILITAVIITLIIIVTDDFRNDGNDM